MKFLVFTPPFRGHSNVLVAFAREYPEHDFKFVVTGWENVPVNLGLPATVLEAPPLRLKDPALWTLPRAAHLLPSCLDIARSYGPDVILYDFFSVEGRLVGEMLGVPTWGSIPAFLEPFDDREYLDAKLSTAENRSALETLRKFTGLHIETPQLEQVSDGFHLPGDLDIVWSYESLVPRDHGSGRATVPRIFAGTLSSPGRKCVEGRPRVLLSFGTVVMGNMWDFLQPLVTGLVSELAQLWTDFDVTFVTQGQTILDEYPKNWTVESFVDQGELLDGTTAFVTHGGSNSFHEAAVRKVPMVVFPFFGDQPAVARRVEELQIGRNVMERFDIDTQFASFTLDDFLVARIDSAVREVIRSPEAFEAAYSRLHLETSQLKDLMVGKIPLKNGDLLYGTNPARVSYVRETGSEEEFQLLKFLPFSKIAPRPDSLPRIVDIYHDSIRDPDIIESEMSQGTEYSNIIRSYRDFLEGETDIARMCLRGIDFFSQLFKIHFILDVYDPDISTITKMEIEYVLINRALFEGRVTFYRKVERVWTPVSYDKVAELIRRPI